MKTLRAIRILLAALFFAASGVCLLLGSQSHPIASAMPGLQITLSSLSVTAGATLVWFLLTYIFGRVYCSTVCPIGFFSDIFFRLGGVLCRGKRKMRYRHKSKLSAHILWIYALCLIAGIMTVAWIVEPWNIARNIASTINRDAVASTWGTIGIGTIGGVIAGIVSAIGIAILSAIRGREFCTRYCPVGTLLGLVGDRALWHIEINHDLCTACGLCEEQCRSECIKVLSRYVDNSRCVRCFDCVAICPEEAIKLQANRNRGATPLMKKVKDPS